MLHPLLYEGVVVNVSKVTEIANCVPMHYVDTRRYYRGRPYLDTIKSVLTTQWIEIMVGPGELKFPMTSHSISWNSSELSCQPTFLLSSCLEVCAERQHYWDIFQHSQHLREGKCLENICSLEILMLILNSWISFYGTTTLDSIIKMGDIYYSK